MLLGSIRRKCALSTTYDKARDTIRKGYVSVSAIDAGTRPGIVSLRGRVKGVSFESYEVSVELDTVNDAVLSYGCTCPAARSLNGMCKHAAAMAITYVEANRSKSTDTLVASGNPSVDLKDAGVSPGQNGGSGIAGLRASQVSPHGRTTTLSSEGVVKQQSKAKAASTAKPAPKPKPEPATSGLITELMARCAEEAEWEAANLPTRSHDACTPLSQPVDLVLCVAQESSRYSSIDAWKVGLKAVCGKVTYVVAHIDEVIHAWQRGMLYTYGKNLEFIHRPEAFTTSANALLEALAPIVDAQLALQSSRELRYYSQPHLNTKMLSVTPRQLAGLLDLARGATVEVDLPVNEGRYNMKRRKSQVSVVQGNPQLAVDLTAGESGGFDLSIRNGDYACMRAGQRLFLLGRDAIYCCTSDFSKDMATFCRALLPVSVSMHIREDDMLKFCASVLPALRKHTRLAAPENVWGLMPPEAEFEFRIGEENGCITCQSIVTYDGQKMDLFEPARVGQPVRHVAREVEAQITVARYFASGVPETPNYAYPEGLRSEYDDYYGGWYERRGRGGRYASGDYGYSGRSDGFYSRYGRPATPAFPWFSADDDDAYYALFTEGLSELSKLGDVLLSERLRTVEVRSTPSVRVEASVKSGLLDLSVESSDMTPEELVAYLASYRRRQRFVRLASGDIVLLDGSVGALADLADGLGINEADLANGTAELPLNRTLFVDAILKRARGVRFSRDEGFRAIVRDFETVADADFAPPAQVADILRGYQTEGFRWLCTLGKVGFGGILADDMGLGKTLQMISYFLHARQQGETLPALVVCPASLVYNWMAELGRFAPNLKAAAVTGSKAERRRTVAQASDFDVLITSYDLMKRDIDDYGGAEFSCAVLDEAQYIKNSTTKAAKAAKQLRARVRFAMTGTPIENRLSELWSIFDYLMPGVLGSQDSFTRRFAAPIGAQEEGAAKRLQSLVGPFILRRLKGDVLRDLPEKDENVVFAEMEGEQAKLYRATSDRLALTLSKQMPEEFASSKLAVLAELTKLRQICCDPHLLYENYTAGSAKLETCMELVGSAVEGGHAILLFSQFTTMLDIIAQRLGAQRISYFMLTGSTTKDQRANLVERFQAGGASVFLISLKAGGVGLNLTAADIVIHYDPWWNLAAQNQATDRAHRIGQTNPVSVFKLIAKGTIEEKIVAMQESKRDLAESVLGGEVVSASAITRDDLLALLEQ